MGRYIPVVMSEKLSVISIDDMIKKLLEDAYFKRSYFDKEMGKRVYVCDSRPRNSDFFKIYWTKVESNGKGN